jgi:hypothetical protein
MALAPEDAAAAPIRNEQLWSAVDGLIDRAPSLSDLRAHRIHLLAARRWRALGRPIPAELLDEERLAAVNSLAASALIQRIRAATDGPLLLLKGPEVAARYPDPALRAFRDLDLLTPDPEKIQSQLLAAGFEAVGDPTIYEFDLHHLRPLCWPGMPLLIEIHKRLNVPSWMPPPPNDELFSVAQPSSFDGLVVLPPAHHALVLAMHSWGRVPLRRVRDLIDVVLVHQDAELGEAEAVAARWRADRLWRMTLAAADAVFFGGAPPAALRIWARNLARVRDRTVLEIHLQRLLSGYWALPPGKAVRACASALADEFRPAFGESWGHKSTRTARAFRNALRGASHHEDVLGEAAHRQRIREGRRPRD